MEFEAPLQAPVEYITLNSQEIAAFLAEDPSRFELPYTIEDVERGIRNNDPNYREVVEIYLEEEAYDRLTRVVDFMVDPDEELLVC